MTPICLVRSSRRCCASSHRSAATTDTCGATPPSAGSTYRANSHLLLLWGAANRDAAQFDTPGEFRLDRGGGKSHVTFGKGAHFCVGAALARLEAQIVLRMLMDRTSWIEAGDVGQWLPSILVRRLEHLEMVVR